MAVSDSGAGKTYEEIWQTFELAFRNERITTFELEKIHKKWRSIGKTCDKAGSAEGQKY